MVICTVNHNRLQASCGKELLFFWITDLGIVSDSSQKTFIKPNCIKQGDKCSANKINRGGGAFEFCLGGNRSCVSCRPTRGGLPRHTWKDV